MSLYYITVFNIYHKDAYKYFLNYDEKKANGYLEKMKQVIYYGQ